MRYIDLGVIAIPIASIDNIEVGPDSQSSNWIVTVRTLGGAKIEGKYPPAYSGFTSPHVFDLKAWISERSRVA